MHKHPSFAAAGAGQNKHILVFCGDGIPLGLVERGENIRYVHTPILTTFEPRNVPLFFITAQEQFLRNDVALPVLYDQNGLSRYAGAGKPCPETTTKAQMVTMKRPLMSNPRINSNVMSLALGASKPKTSMNTKSPIGILTTARASVPIARTRTRGLTTPVRMMRNKTPSPSRKRVKKNTKQTRPLQESPTVGSRMKSAIMMSVKIEPNPGR